MAVVIYTEDEGVYLGCCFGLAFWSKLDPVDLPGAVTFPTVDDVEKHMAEWESGRPPDAALVKVEPDLPDDYASIEACMRAGLPEWLTSDSETANDRPI